jgi:hypothetical protein
MKINVGTIFGLACVFGNSSLIFAQSASNDSSRVEPQISLTIQTNIDSAAVIIDSNQVGFTPLTITSITPGLHLLKLIHPDPANWLTSNISDSIILHTGDTRTLRYAFDTRFVVASQPYGAEVLVNDSLVGTTPLVLRTTSMLDRGTLRIRKPEYEEALIEVNDQSRGFVPVTLKKKWGYDGGGSSMLNEITKKNSSFRLYLVGATAIVSGATAAFCKIKADDRYNAYQQTGVPSLLSETNRLDTISAVALIATQLSLGLFTYFMLSD